MKRALLWSCILLAGCCVRRLGGYSARQPHLYQCRKSPPQVRL